MNNGTLVDKNEKVYCGDGRIDHILECKNNKKFSRDDLLDGIQPLDYDIHEDRDLGNNLSMSEFIPLETLNENST